MNLPLKATVVVSALALAACGGGGDGGPTTAPAVHTVGLPDTHSLADWLTAHPGGGVPVPAGEHRDIGGVRFSCPAGGADCAVTVMSENGTLTVSSTGGMVSAALAPPPVHAVERIIQSADTILLGDIVLSGDDFNVRIEANCSGATCTISALGQQETISLSEFTDDLEDEWPTATETYRGVRLIKDIKGIEADAIGDIGDLSGGLAGFGGWLDHNFFIVVRATLSDADSGDFSIPLVLSIGDAAGTNPAPIAGSATWSGVMVGTDMSATALRSQIRGDADITVSDFTNPTVGVAFTKIRNPDTGDSRGDMTWSGIPLTDGGFGMGSDGNSIEGRLYGPNHEEVGGVFEREQVIGAFSAKR